MKCIIFGMVAKYNHIYGKDKNTAMGQLYRLSFMVLYLSIGFVEVNAVEQWEAEVLPSERFITQDETSGAKLIFVTRSEASDVNAYFHQRAWLKDESVLFFYSDRTGRNEVFGYLEETGELIRLQRDGDEHIDNFTAGLFDNVLYFARGKKVYQWRLKVTVSPNPAEQRSKIEVTELLVAHFPPDAGDRMLGISESSCGEGIVVAFNSIGPHANRIVWIDKKIAEAHEIAAVDYPITHIQCSWETPDLVSFAREYPGEGSDRAMNIPTNGEMRARIHLADLSDRCPWPVYPQVKGELVTHESWWVHDQIIFCSGENNNGHAEEAHVKVYDPRINRTYIIGPGSWWEGCTPEEVSKVNYWHSSGSPDGRFAAGDNWHGDIALFSAKTARTRILTQGHRTYGKGAHPHVGWSPSSSKLLFASNRFGNVDVCIAVMPDEWLNTNW